jgi:hypothetical protein
MKNRVICFQTTVFLLFCTVVACVRDLTALRSNNKQNRAFPFSFPPVGIGLIHPFNFVCTSATSFRFFLKYFTKLTDVWVTFEYLLWPYETTTLFLETVSRFYTLQQRHDVKATYLQKCTALLFFCQKEMFHSSSWQHH